MADKKPRVDYSKLRIQKTRDQVQAEELLQRLEAELDRVKLQYQLYFIGTNAKPPDEDRGKLERLSRFCRQHIPTRTVERFKMHNLLTKAANMLEHWDKTVRRIEAGERISWVPITLRATAEEASQEGTASANGKESSGYLACLQDPLNVDEEPEVRKVYNSYIAARKKVDAEGQELPFERFQHAIAKQVQGLLAKDAKAVQFRIEIADGRVSLKAKPVRE